MSRSSQIVSSIFFISMLVLPAFLVLGFLVHFCVYNMLIAPFSITNEFMTTLGILFLILHLAPPPPNKKKRIMFFQKLKGICKRFYKQTPTEEIVFTDDIIHFAECKHLQDHSGSSFPYLEFFLSVAANGVVKFPSTTSHDTLQDTNGTLKLIQESNRSRTNKVNQRRFLSPASNIFRNSNFSSVFQNLFEPPNQTAIWFAEEALRGGISNFEQKIDFFSVKTQKNNNKRGVYIG